MNAEVVRMTIWTLVALIAGYGLRHYQAQILAWPLSRIKRWWQETF